MWEIELTEKSGRSTLVCTTDSQDNLRMLKIIRTGSLQTQFILQVLQQDSALALIADFSEALPGVQINCNRIVAQNHPVGANQLIHFVIPIIVSFELFNAAITVLEKTIDDFSTFKQQIDTLMRYRSLTFTAALKRNAIETDALFVAARANEMKLRETYNFPAPTKDKNCQYRERDRTLIKELHDTLAARASNYVASGILEIKAVSEAGVEYALTTTAMDLLDQSKNGTEKLDPNVQMQVSATKNALTITTTLQAIKSNGSHSRNGAIAGTDIEHYGLRDIVALMWHCIKEISAQHSLAKVIDDCLTALCHGITNVPEECSDKAAYESLFVAMAKAIAKMSPDYLEQPNTGVETNKFVAPKLVLV